MDNITALIKKVLSNDGRGWTIGKIIKTTVLVVVALFALSIVLAMFKWVFGIGGGDYSRNNMTLKRVFDEPAMMLGYAEDMVEQGFSKGDRGGGYDDGMAVSSSMVRGKMIAPMGIPMMLSEDVEASAEDAGLQGSAEDFETREYRASYEERNISKTCEKFEELKPLDYVVFSNANKSDSYCSYSFKVELEHESEILLLVESLDPKDFNANTFTLERNITSNTNEIEILERKIKMLDALLASAQAKYAALRNTGDTGALVSAINNEISLIERITNQKLTVQGRIDRLTNSTGVQTERIDYSQFNISVNERKFIDWSGIGEQWKSAFEHFISSISEAIQDMTIGLVMFALKLTKFVLFLSVGVLAIVAAAKFLWTISKKIWRR